MKKLLLSCMAWLMMTGIPLAGLYQSASAEDWTAVQPNYQDSAGSVSGVQATATRNLITNIDSFRIYNQSTGRIDVVSIEDYVRGAIAAEMPASYSLEAMKAQGVCALTNALYNAYTQRSSRTRNPSFHGGDFAADPSNRKGYMTQQEAISFYGAKWQQYWGKVCAAAEEACQMVMLSPDGVPFQIFYHAISAGRTEFPENIWGGSVPCTGSVESSWDASAPGYLRAVATGTEELYSFFSRRGVELSSDPGKWFGEPVYSDAGYILQIRIGNTIFTGRQLRELLGLRSSAISITVKGEQVIFETRGYGHGAGMSQYGADYLARQGWNCRQILEHYYPGVSIGRLVIEES